jgi:hypothetical protein
MKLIKKYLFLPLVALFLFAINANAQLEFPEDKVSWKYSLEQNGTEAFVVVEITVLEHWHVYGANLPEGSFLLPTEVEPDQSDNYEVIGKVIEPKPEFYHDEAADEDIFQHSKSFTLKRKIKVLSEKDFTLKGRFSFQTCDESHCLPPFDTDFSLKVKGIESVASTGGRENSAVGIGSVDLGNDNHGADGDSGGMQFAEDKVDWKFSVEQDKCHATIIAEVTCAEHWHVSGANLPEGSLQGATWIEPSESNKYKLVEGLVEPKPEFFHDEAAD